MFVSSGSTPATTFSGVSFGYPFFHSRADDHGREGVARINAGVNAVVCLTECVRYTRRVIESISISEYPREDLFLRSEDFGYCLIARNTTLFFSAQ